MEKIKVFQEIENAEFPQNIKTLPTMEQLAYYWPILASLLKFAMIFTGKKGDEKITAILEWGEITFPKE